MRTPSAARSEAAEAELTAAVAAEGEARNARREAQAQADAARDAHAAAEREASRLTARLSALAEAKIRLTSSRDETIAAKHDAVQAIEQLGSAADLEHQLAETRGEVAAKRAVLAEARGEAQALAREAELRARRIAAIAAERAEWDGRKVSAAGQAATLGERSTEAQAERSSLEGAPAAIAEQRRALISEIEAAEAAQRAASDRRVAAEAALAEADKAARAALEAMGEARTEQARAEERLEAANRRTTDVAHEIREMLETEPENVAALAEIAPGAELPDVAATEERLEKLRRDRERLGAVNLRAEEELREVDAQHASLVTERDDLTEAIKRLRQGIQSLNREARERLLSSFAVVNGHFQRLFTSLFGGGTAELQLIESDDPLEAGLDILAKPPGKKPATLSLLSGGEQALTALGADLRGVPHQPGADLRAGRGGRAARRSQRRPFLRPARRDDTPHRHAFRDHHAQPDHHGADEPPLRRDDGRARHFAARLGRSGDGGEDQGSGLAP